MTLPALKKYLPQKKKNQIPALFEAPFQICENCGHSYTGNFCPMCGQKGGEYKKSIIYIMGHFFNHFFSLDNKTLTTLKRLIFKPGQLTIDYINGKRVSHTPPFRLFLFISFVFFFVLNQYITFENKDQIIMDIKSTNKQDTLKKTISASTLSANLLETTKNPEKEKGIETTLDNQIKESLQESKTKDLAEKDAKTTDTVKLKRDLFINSFFNNASKFILILLPFMALLFQLFFFRRGKYYIEHLMLSVNLHSLLFLQAAVLILLSFIWNISYIWCLWFFLFVPIYFIRSFHNFYKVSYKRAVAYFSAISFIYFLFFALLNVVNMIWVIKEKEYIFNLGDSLKEVL